MNGAKKHFGQHFLNDRSVLECIAHTVNARLSDSHRNANKPVNAPASVFEIGPGRGALTRVLLSSLPRHSTLTCLEIDRDLIVYLTQQFASELASGRLRLIETDVLAYDFSSLPAHTMVVGNLPYNISSPILFHLLPHASQIDAQIFMLQKEVVDRMVALPRHESPTRVSGRVYGRLSVVLQWRYAMSLLCDVAPEAFSPPPKVWSSIVVMTPHQHPNPYSLACSFNALEKVVATAFNQRRKQVANSLANLFTLEQLCACGITPSDRAEDLGLTQYISLAQQLTRNTSG